jgi:hypothetical protein
MSQGRKRRKNCKAHSRPNFGPCGSGAGILGSWTAKPSSGWGNCSHAARAKQAVRLSSVCLFEGLAESWHD